MLLQAPILCFAKGLRAAGRTEREHDSCCDVGVTWTGSGRYRNIHIQRTCVLAVCYTSHASLVDRRCTHVLDELPLVVHGEAEFA